MKENIKSLFLENLKASGGIIYVACENTGINRCTYYRWRDTDVEFSNAVEEIMEAQIDFVESKLMSLINQGDKTATIFYLKTKGKKRGWSENQNSLVTVDTKDQFHASIPALLGEQVKQKTKVTVKKRIKNKKDYIVRLLKKQGKYTAELSMQVTITAQLLVRTEILAEEVLADDHEAINVEVSREGNPRESISPKEKLYLDFVQQSQKALQALGMNTDSKERKSDNDSFSEFLKEFTDEEEKDSSI